MTWSLIGALENREHAVRVLGHFQEEGVSILKGSYKYFDQYFKMGTLEPLNMSTWSEPEIHNTQIVHRHLVDNDWAKLVAGPGSWKEAYNAFGEFLARPKRSLYLEDGSNSNYLHMRLRDIDRLVSLELSDWDAVDRFMEDYVFLVDLEMVRKGNENKPTSQRKKIMTNGTRKRRAARKYHEVL